MPTLPPNHRTTARIKASSSRLSPTRRGYGRPWQALRRRFLAEHPLCMDCEPKGIIEAAAHVDHHIAREAGGTDDDSNLRALCHSCHSAKTVAVDGGFGNPRKR